MADWLIHLLIQLGGYVAVLAVAGFIMGKWLWAKLNAALDSYNKAYHEQKGAIDARINRIEKLVEEQARLTRAVESIKDQIAAQRKRHDNRWEFQKDVYSDLIKSVVNLMAALNDRKTLVQSQRSPSASDIKAAAFLDQQVQANNERLRTATMEFVIHARLAPLATADDILPALELIRGRLHFDFDSPTFQTQADQAIEALSRVLTLLQIAGRKALDLWEESEPKPKADAVT
jgi:hypothetical protein